MTIRDVASELGVTLVSLYYYIQNRDDLINAIIARVGEGIVQTDPQDTGIDEVEGYSSPSTMDCITTPGGPPSGQGPPSGAAVLPLEQRALVALEGMGMDRGEAWHGYLSLEHHLFGEILATNSFQQQTKEVMKASDDSLAAFPLIDAFCREGTSVPGEPRDFYRIALRRMIRALAAEGSEEGSSIAEGSRKAEAN